MSEESEKSSGDPQDTNQKKRRLAARLEAGFREWHSLKSESLCLKRKSLDLALEYGPLLLEWKELVGHGPWQKEVREKVQGADLRTCNRWKRIAQQKDKVLAALTQWPGARWGLVRMLAYLSGRFNPSCPDQDQETEGPDPEAGAQTLGEGLAAPTSGGQVDGLGDNADDDESPAESPTIPTATSPRTGLGFGDRILAKIRPGKKGRNPVGATATSGEAEYEVEVVKIVKVTVPKSVTEDAVKAAFENRQVQFEISVHDQSWTLSDEGLPGKVNHVQPWG